jgi:hypothetical protein
LRLTGRLPKSLVWAPARGGADRLAEREGFRRRVSSDKSHLVRAADRAHCGGNRGSNPLRYC